MTAIEHAVESLRSGGLVAFPTETVYGLGADATNTPAVRKIFKAKGRPATNPLIVHVMNAEIARRYCTAWPAAAEKLAATFWPGPLTLVLPKAQSIGDEVTAGRKTVGLRVPRHPVALELLEKFGVAVAAPSANRSNHVSPTTAEHVREELGKELEILDGGPCAVGIESTVLDLSAELPTILRPGNVTREQIEAIIGAVGMFGGSVESGTAASSPGLGERHYSPVTPTFLFEGEAPYAAGVGVVRLGKKTLTPDPLPEYRARGPEVVLPNDPVGYARLLYAALRELDRQKLQAIQVEMPPDSPEWTAVRDRIHRAGVAISH